MVQHMLQVKIIGPDFITHRATLTQRLRPYTNSPLSHKGQLGFVLDIFVTRRVWLSSLDMP
jgi:hypothetical protein